MTVFAQERGLTHENWPLRAGVVRKAPGSPMVIIQVSLLWEVLVVMSNLAPTCTTSPTLVVLPHHHTRADLARELMRQPQWSNTYCPSYHMCCQGELTTTLWVISDTGVGSFDTICQPCWNAFFWGLHFFQNKSWTPSTQPSGPIGFSVRIPMKIRLYKKIQ